MNVLLAIKNALGFRRYLILGFVTAGAVFYGTVRTALAPQFELPQITTLQLFAAVVPTLVLWFVARRAAELEDRMKPRLAFAKPHVSYTKQKEIELFVPGILNNEPTYYEAAYVHVVISNTSEEHIDGCRAVLLSATRAGNDAKIGSPIKLVSASYHDEETTIAPNVPLHFDILFVTDRTKVLEMTDGLRKPNYVGEFFHGPGTYRLTVAATGQRTATVTRDILVTWNGTISQLTAELA